MPLIGGSTFVATFKGMQLGQLIENVLRWDSDQTTGRVVSYFVAAYLDSLWRTAVIPLLSKDYYYLGVNVHGTYESGDSAVEGVLLAGDMLGDALPPFLAANCRKTVLPTGQEGVDAGELTYGSMRLAGIPESVQANGLPTDAGWIGDVDAALTGLLTITGLTGQTSDLHMTVVRPAPGGVIAPPRAIGVVGAFNFQRFSTQNSRKR